MVNIKLQDTLGAFYADEDHKFANSTRSRTFILYNPISDAQLASWLPRNRKYMIQQWRGDSGDSSVIMNLILMPQRMAWMLGNMSVIFPKDEEPANQADVSLFNSLDADLVRTLSVLDAECRFRPQFCTSMVHVRQSVGDSEIIPYLPSDGIDSIHYMNPDDHYEILSKRKLALSGLPTPKARIIDFKMPEMGWTETTVGEQVEQAIMTIRSHPLPFVLKTNSAGGGKGTYVVHTLAQHADVESAVEGRLRSELWNLGPDNARLNPCSLVLTQVLPGNTVSINFYVRMDGTVQFSSCCEQNMSTSGHWLGGTIIYSQQQRLGLLYSDTVEKVARFLQSCGYHGPVGIDVMWSDQNQPQVVDLNPRPTGTFILGGLRTHFTEGLHMDAACVLPYMTFIATRDDFHSAFWKELESGQIVILAWCSEPGAGRSHTCIVVGAKDRNIMSETCESVRHWVQGTFSKQGEQDNA